MNLISTILKQQSFHFFIKKSHFTDDTIMTPGCWGRAYEWVQRSGGNRQRNYSFHAKAGKTVSGCRIRLRFQNWVYEKNPVPYHSYGNGSAMRVSAAPGCMTV